MKPKIVTKFRRSLSFPNHPTLSSKSTKTHHVRSISLPNRSHPLISHLKEELTALRHWGSKLESLTTGWLCNGLSRLRAAHEYLDDILQLPQTRDSLSRQTQWVEMVLEDFLQFIDVYGIFRNLVLALNREHSAAQVAIRRKDDSKMASYVKAIKKLGKEIYNLISTVRSVGINSVSLSALDADAELAELVKDVIEITVLVSVKLFNGISTPFVSRRLSWMGVKLPKRTKEDKTEGGIEEFLNIGKERLWNLRKKGDEEMKMVVREMHDMEEGILGIEVGSERVFRSLINTRVSLLNVLTK